MESVAREVTGPTLCLFSSVAFATVLAALVASLLFYLPLIEWFVRMGDAAGEIKEWITHFRYGCISF